MKKDIYIIRNTVNDKCYIGQSNDYKYRFRKHCEAARRNNHKYKSYLYNAMNTIGIDKFYVELLESGVEDYNEKEIYYIKKYNTLRPNGYNLAKGGGGYPHLSGVDHHDSKIKSQEELDQIYDELLNSDYSLTDIGKHFGVSYGLIEKINKGQTYKNNNYKYPLRDFVLSKNKLDELYDDLKNTNLSYKQLSDKYKISINQIKGINSGNSWHKDLYPYPIRRINFGADKEIIDALKNDLIYTTDSFEILAKIYDCSFSTLRRINIGESYYDDKLDYPLRKTRYE